MPAPARSPAFSERLKQRPVRYFWYLCLIIALTSETWRKWPDLVVDFGTQLYGPWRVSEGAVPYRDVATVYGPLSLAFNSLLFRLLGVSFTTLFSANLVLLLLLTAMVDAFFMFAASELAAVASVTTLLTVFAFGQHMNNGNYNFIAPYSHEATHAFILAIAMVTLLTRWARRPALSTVAAAGTCLGLVLLAKPETSVAATFAAGVAFLLAWRTGRAIAQALAVFVGAAAAPMLIAFLLFLREVPFRAAVRGALGAFAPVHAAVSSTPFFGQAMGLDHPLRNLGIAGLVTVVLALIMALGLIADTWSRDTPSSRPWIALTLGGSVVLALTAHVFDDGWTYVARPVPFVACAVLAWAAVRLWRTPADPDAPRLFALAVWAAFSIALIGRLLLKAQVFHFGFVVALPATLLLVVVWTDLAPRLIAGRSDGFVAKTVGLAFLVSFVWVQLRVTAAYDDKKDYALGPGADAIVVANPFVSSKTAAFARALERIETLVPPGGTLAALPHGVLLNYWSRRRNPTPYIVIGPAEAAIFGEDEQINAYRQSPPDLILIVHSDATELGLKPFGYDDHYGARLMAWVRSEYEIEETILDDPASYDRFGIQVLTRRKRDRNAAAMPTEAGARSL